MALSEEEFLDDFQHIDALEFEKFIAELWELQDWDTYTTKEADDGGVDVIAERSIPVSKKEAIQVKRYSQSNSVGRPDIQQYASLKQERTDVDTVVVVTTSQFTEGATNVAQKLNVKLVDGSHLYTIVKELGAIDLALSYIESAGHRDPNVAYDNENGSTGGSSQQTDAKRDVNSIIRYDESIRVENAPDTLPALVNLRKELVTDLDHVRNLSGSAEEALQEERYREAMQEYENLTELREHLRRDILLYKTGLDKFDSDTTEHLPSAESLATQLAQITEHMEDNKNKASQIVEQLIALDELADEVRSNLNTVKTCLVAGDKYRQRAQIEEAYAKYDEADKALERAEETMEMYQGLVDTQDDEVSRNHDRVDEEISLSEIRATIEDRLDSKAEYREVQSIPENATGSFRASLLKDNHGELFDQDLIDYVEEDEQIEFVFKPPRRGFKRVSPDGIAEVVHKSTSKEGGSFLVVTDRRVLYVAGLDDYDETQSIDFDDITNVEVSTDATSEELQLSFDGDKKYIFTGVQGLQEAARYISRQLDDHP